jgi:hypothetical protein
VYTILFITLQRHDGSGFSSIQHRARFEVHWFRFRWLSRFFPLLHSSLSRFCWCKRFLFNYRIFCAVNLLWCSSVQNCATFSLNKKFQEEDTLWAYKLI